MAVSKAKKQGHGLKAAIYARVSDKRQDEDDKTSISEQISDMEAHCERKSMKVVARYQEVGRGWSKKRPEFQRMLADARRGRFDTIVCWKSDRLSRGMYPAAALMEVIEAYHINLEAVMDAIDMKTFGLMAAIGKIELDNFRERSSMGKRGSAKQGRIPVSNVPYGYRVGDDGRPEIVEEEAEVVRRVYRMSVNDGMGAYVIARQLTLEGVPMAKTGKRWYDGTIHRLLSNETYKGTWWYGKARYVSTEDGIRVYDQPEEQMDHQRKYITERLETLRARLDDYRDRESAETEKLLIMENLVQWAGEFGEGLDDLPDEKRREVLRLLLDGVTIDGQNNLNLTLAIPTEEFVSIGTPISDSLSKTRPPTR